jgi:hypothetical protein
MKNLWPDNLSQKEHKTTPKEFLAQQISYLSENTKVDYKELLAVHLHIP